jgi:hypothetical protein
MPWDEVRWKDSRTGKPLRWYQLLAAMCEPFLDGSPHPAVPSRAALAQRLGVSKKVVEGRLAAEVRDELGFDSYSERLSETMVSIAISQRLVTPSDLAVLDVAAWSDGGGK